MLPELLVILEQDNLRDSNQEKTRSTEEQEMTSFTVDTWTTRSMEAQAMMSSTEKVARTPSGVTKAWT